MTILAQGRTGLPETDGIPRPSALVEDAKGKVIFVPEYRSAEAVRGLDEFSHIWLLWQFSASHRDNWTATVRPPRLGGKKRVGVFASRSPFRPNDIGLSCVRLERVEQETALGPVLWVAGVDLLDGTPVYDIKPYIPLTDCHPEATEGYTEETKRHELQVIFPEELLQIYPEEERRAAVGILAQDPRPAYVMDPERIYGVSYAGYDIKFRVAGDVLTVCGVIPLAGR
ncbi:MAG: tRNA (N6-threonylcarbamoyladenosine(37)-N6)-methyltransferase TrmO [Clostridiales bacterium]|nr:tRNA (N6-threonylcarbamoyladenosine(37)-N6)-methyltransferase TrmO [Clostridiales bacterium]